MKVIHGARSRVQKVADVRRLERKAARQYGVLLRSMTATQRGYLRLWAESVRLVERLEPLTIASDGTASTNGNVNTFLAAVNSAGRAWERLDASMGQTRHKRTQQDTLDELAKYRSSAS